MKRRDVNGIMVTLARESRGLSQKQLADNIKIAQGTLSKIEQNLKSVTNDILEGLSEVLDYPSNFFLEQEYIYPPFQPFHRKRQSYSKKDEKTIEAKANIHRVHVSKLLKSIEINDDVPNFDLDDFNNQPDEVAIALRRYWSMPKGPIENITDLLEQAGIIVFPIDFQTDKLDGFTIIAPRCAPIIFINTFFPGDRMRFTLCHELGHIVMHSRFPTQNAEDEANRFASEMLMPAKEIKSKLTMLNIPKLAALKPYWKVSMSALLKRAGDLYTITKRQSQYLWIKMGPYRKREPVNTDIPREEPKLFKELLRLHREELEYNDDELRNLLLLSDDGYENLIETFLGNRSPLKKLKLVK